MAAEPARDLARLPVALTISGSTLPAHEAGALWSTLTLLRHARQVGLPVGEGAWLRSLRPDVVAIAGTSAGSINTLLASMTWCQNDRAAAEDSVVDNPFYKVWINAGVEDLFPGDSNCADYRRDSLARHEGVCRDHRFSPKEQEQCLSRLRAHVRCGDCAAQRQSFDRRHPEVCGAAPQGWQHETCLALSVRCHDDGYQPEERAGVFTRNGYAAPAAWLQTAMARQDAFDSCSLTAGVDIARAAPLAVTLLGPNRYSEGLTTESTRVVGLLRATAGSDGLSFENSALAPDPASAPSSELGIAIRLPEDARHRVSFDDAFGLVEASSAVPILFAPKELECLPEDRAICAGLFVDAGFLDNEPLGIAHYLMLRLADDPHPPEALQPRPAGSYDPTQPPPVARFLLIDPMRRRGSSNPGPLSQMTAQSWGLGLDFDFIINGVIPMARQADVQSLARYAWSNVPRSYRTAADQWRLDLSVSSRAHPLAGEYLGTFGDFLAREFREFDYRVGVYDGLYSTARSNCRLVGRESDETCLFEAMGDGLQVLRISDADTAWVVAHLFEQEFPVTRSMTSTARSSWRTTMGLLEETVRRAPPASELIRAFTAEDVWEVRDAGGKRRGATYDELIRNLVREYRSLSPRGRLPPVLASPEWLWNTLTDVSFRVHDVELREGSPTGQALVNAEAFLLLTKRSQYRLGLVSEPSTVPGGVPTAGKVLAHFLPYELTTDLVRPGIELGYQGLLAPWPQLWFVSNLSPLGWQSHPASEVAPHGRFFSTFNLGAMVRLDNISDSGWTLLMPSFDVQFRGVCRWTPDTPGDRLDVERLSPGLEVGANLVGGKLRLAYTWCSRCGIGETPQSGVRLGFEDINGILYWVLETALR